jgi:hypothetical protein
MFIQTTAQQLDKRVYKHVTNLLHISAFFDHPQGGIRRRKTQRLPLRLCSFKRFVPFGHLPVLCFSLSHTSLELA